MSCKACLTRDIVAATAADEFDVLVRALSPTWTGPEVFDVSAQMCLKILPDDAQRSTFQEQALIKIYVELMRSENTLEKLKKMDTAVQRLAA